MIFASVLSAAVVAAVAAVVAAFTAVVAVLAVLAAVAVVVVVAVITALTAVAHSVAAVAAVAAVVHAAAAVAAAVAAVVVAAVDGGGSARLCQRLGAAPGCLGPWEAHQQAGGAGFDKGPRSMLWRAHVVNPPTLALPPPIHTTSLPEHTTVLRTQYEETVINNTIFDTLRTDEGKKSSILEKVFDESTIFEECNFQQVMYKENDEEEFANLEQTCFSTYYRRNLDNNKIKFKRLGKQPVVNKYGFSQDNYYLTNFYNDQKEKDDKYEQNRLIEQKRIDATVRFEDNQTQARQNERDTENPIVEILRQSSEQQNNRKRTNDTFVEQQIQKKRKITDNC